MAIQKKKTRRNASDSANSESSSPSPRRQTRSRGNRQIREDFSTDDESDSDRIPDSNSTDSSSESSSDNQPVRNEQRNMIRLGDGVITRTGRLVRPPQKIDCNSPSKSNDKKLPRRSVPEVSEDEMHSSLSQQKHQKTTRMQTRRSIFNPRQSSDEELEQPSRRSNEKSQRTTTIETRRFRQCRNFSTSDEDLPKRKPRKVNKVKKDIIQNLSLSTSDSSDSTQKSTSSQEIISSKNTKQTVSRRHSSNQVVSSKKKENKKKIHQSSNTSSDGKPLIKRSITHGDKYKELKPYYHENSSDRMTTRQTDFSSPLLEFGGRPQAHPSGRKIHRKFKLTRNSVITLFTSSDSDLNL